jgi:shikimate 5-dehydrogenase
LIADHRRELAAAELAVNTAVNAWMRGDATDAAASLSEMARRWSALEVDDIVVADWPSGIVGG